MEGRVAQGQVKAFALLQQAAEDVRSVGLLAQGNGFAQAIGLDDSLGRGQSHGVDV
ncbi:hypothetical protein D9M71_614690 [compost metagenome]